MNQNGHLDSSANVKSIHFQVEDNSKNVLHLLKKLHINNFKSNENINKRVKIFEEKGAPYIILKTNLSSRPLKFLIDTGASISLISDSALSSTVRKTDIEMNVFGIIGKDVSVKTQGIVAGILDIDNHFFGTLFHVIEKKYLNSADAYLGYDFLSPYKVKLDMENMFLNININDIKRVFGRDQKSEITDTNINMINSEEEEKRTCAHDLNMKENNLNENEKREPYNFDDLEENEIIFLYILGENYDFDSDKTGKNEANINTIREQDRAEYIFDHLDVTECNEDEKKLY